MRDSDTTLILRTGLLDGGTQQTLRFARTLGKPLLVIQLDELTLGEGRFSALNVAGLREEKRSGIHAGVRALLDACFLGGGETH